MISLLLGLILASPQAAAQDTLHLPALQQAAVARDPRTDRLALEEATSALRLRTIAVERLPELTLSGEAVHRSEVAAIPLDLPDADVPTPPDEHYEVALDASWLLFDGGVLGARRDAEGARLASARAELAAELYPLRVEVTEAFFAALVLQERLRELATLVVDLEARLSQVRDHVQAGAALPGDTATVRAEMLRVTQQSAEVAAERRASLAVLAELTGRGISEADVLALPDLDDAVARVRSVTGPEGATAARVHPTYAVFEARREALEREAALIRARAGPRLSAFGRYAYGRPGLRQFTDDFHDYWLAGLRFQWVPWDRGTTAREIAEVRIQQRIVEAEEAAFAGRLARRVQRPLEAMSRLRAALATDERIIVLREQVERQARAQLGERAITAAAYVDARTDLQEARVTLLRHRAELARAQADYLATLGVELR